MATAVAHYFLVVQTFPKTLDPAQNWRRLTEWGAMAALVLALIASFVHYSRYVRGQAELAAIKSTVGALRTAFIVEHMRQQVAGQIQQRAALPVDFDPFALLQQPPVNYAGRMRRAQSESVFPGAWVFAPECPCVGYRPSYDQWLESPADDALIWFELTGMPGVLQLVTKEKYLWNNELIE